MILTIHFDFVFIYCALLSRLQAVHMLVTAATDLQKDIVDGGRVSYTSNSFIRLLHVTLKEPV